LGSLRTNQAGQIVAQTTYLQFDGLKNPVALEKAAPLFPMISDVLGGWPHSTARTSKNDPFITINPGDDNHWSLTLAEAPTASRSWNAVNVICDLVAEMAWERIRSDPSLLCLHAAAVEFSGRLVVFPNARRAGKSTLTAVLARLGHRVYTDDFLPVLIDEQSETFRGIANGVLPRIRLPLPDNFSDDLHAWVQQDQGPYNKQYKYLRSAPIAPGGETMPLGAMIVLDRQDHPVAPALTTIPREDALTSLITQNFARTQFSGAILKSMDALTRHLPEFRLTYHCAESAAKFLSSHEALQDLPAAKNSDIDQTFEYAPLEKVNQPAPEFVSSCRYVQAPGPTETQAGHDHFLADCNGLAIYRLNAGSVAIWRVLSEPTTLDEVVDILTTAFDKAPVSQITADSENLMRSLVAANLIIPAGAA
jgi:hypothetical protein